MSENHFLTSFEPRDDIELLMAEARSVDALRSGRATKVPDSARGDDPDPSILLILCRALENEASSGLQSLKREHLIKIHGSLTSLREDVERHLTGALEPISA